jgi:hypothetical protein
MMHESKILQLFIVRRQKSYPPQLARARSGRSYDYQTNNPSTSMCSTWSAIKTRLSLHHIGESEAASDAAQLIPRDRRRSQTNFEYVFHAGKRINVNSTLILDRTLRASRLRHLAAYAAKYIPVCQACQCVGGEGGGVGGSGGSVARSSLSW